MADMGFLPDVRKLLDQTSPDRQTMLYSATLDREVKVLVDQYQHDPVEHAVAELEPDISLLAHRFIQVPKRERIWLTADLVTDIGSTIVFVRTRHGADRVARQLKAHGVKAAAIHGGRSQPQRDQALAQFIENRVQALVATDVAARGIHVDGVEAVVHYDPPAEDKDYVHRSGRTARAGASGVVVSLLDKPQVRESLLMQNRLGIESDVEATPERVHHLEPLRPGSKGGSRSGSAGSKSRARSKSGSRSRSGSKRSRSEAEPTGFKRSRSETEPTGSKQSDDRRSTTRGSKPGSTRKSRAKADETPDSGSTSTPSSQGRPKSKGKPKGGSKAGSKQGVKRSSGRPASKRSGKPRPKNRKNKSNGGRRRR